MIVRNRLIITGSPKSGKTTLLDALSNVELSVSSIFESNALDGSSDAITLDYGELTLDDDRVLEIYASPGQKRFQFIWKNLARKALGLIILLDNRRPNPLMDMDIYLENFDGIIPWTSTLILVNHADTPGSPSMADFSAKIRERELPIPVVAVDPRQADEAFYALAILTAGIAF